MCETPPAQESVMFYDSETHSVSIISVEMGGVVTINGKEECDLCNGQGRWDDHFCPRCGGSGKRGAHEMDPDPSSIEAVRRAIRRALDNSDAAIGIPLDEDNLSQ